MLVVVLVPLTHRLWRRFGLASFWALAVAAAAVDAVWLAGGVVHARWLNYALVWLAVHQLGYAWREGASWPAALA